MTVARGPVVIRRRLGFILRQLRTRRGLHLDSVARELEISPSKLSRLETGQVEPKTRDVRDLLELYGANAETREQVMQWAFDAKQPGWWQPFGIDVPADMDLYISLEAEAYSIQTYSLPINGLLQTPEYARAILTRALPDATPSQIDSLVRVRTGRRIVLDSERMDGPVLQLHAILDESALHRIPLNATILRHQLRELLERSEQKNITLQVLPFSAGYVSADSTFTIFEPRRSDDWAVVNVESTGADLYYDTPQEINKYRTFWNDVSARALDPETSRTLIQFLIDK